MDYQSVNPDYESLKLILFISGSLILVLLAVVGFFLRQQVTVSQNLTKAVNELTVAINVIQSQATKKILQESLTGVPDSDLPEYKTVYKAWRVPEPVYNQTDSPTGEADIRQWKDTLYRCIQSHTTQLDWEPDREPALWGKVGGEEIIEWYADIWMVIQVGELVQWQGKVYQCVNPTFAWIEPGTPDAYNGWTYVRDTQT